MTGFLSFSIDSIKKRKELQMLIIIQIFLAFLVYYFIMIADIVISALFESDVAENLINTSFVNLWGAFFIIMTVIAFLFTSLLLIYVLRLGLFYQSRDMAIMIGIGGLYETIQNFFLVQLLLMNVLSNLVGIIIAVIVTLFTVIVSNIFFSTIVQLNFIYFDKQVIVVFIIIFFLTYLVSAKFITNQLSRYQDSLYNDKIDFNESSENNFLVKLFIWGKKPINGFTKITIRFSRLNIMRYSFVFIMSLLINIIYSFFLISLVFGSLVVSDSTSSIMTSGIGENNYLIVDSRQSEFFKKSFIINTNYDFKMSFQYTNSLFSYSKVLNIINSSGLIDSIVDERIIIYKNMNGITPSKSIDSEKFNEGIFDSGTIKHTEGFIIGLGSSSPNSPNWKFYGEDPKDILNSNNIVVGEKLAWNLFADPLRGKVYLDENSKVMFQSKSLILDPFLKGNTMYMNLNTFGSFFNIHPDYRNMIIIHSTDEHEIKNLKTNLLKNAPQLVLLSTNDFILKNNDFNSLFMVFLLVQSIPLLIIYCFISMTYFRQIIEERSQQLDTLKALGCKLIDFQSIIMKEIDAFTFWGLTIGFVFANFFIIQMVVPFPIININSLLITISILIFPYIIIRKLILKEIMSKYAKYIF